jgi:hypothetical protein
VLGWRFNAVRRFGNRWDGVTWTEGVTMNLVKLKTVEYPKSDGPPMGETDDHRDAMIRIIELLKRHFRNQMVDVGGDLLVY